MLRSFLVVPAVKLDRYWSHLQTLDEGSTPDAVVIDLEDSVPPNRKAEAVEILGAWLRRGPPPLARKIPVLVKIDNPRIDLCAMQLAALRELAPHFSAIKIAKLEHPEELTFVRERLVGSGLALMPTIETPAGCTNREALIRWCREQGARYVSFGAGDMASALLVRRSYAVDVLKHAFLELALTSAAHRMLFIDSPSRVIPKPGVADWGQEIERECAWSFSNGARAKTAIHPAQIPIIHAAWAKHFDLARAEQLEAQFRAEPRFRSLVDKVSGEYIGTPSLATARRLKALADSPNDLGERL